MAKLHSQLDVGLSTRARSGGRAAERGRGRGWGGGQRDRVVQNQVRGGVQSRQSRTSG